MTDTTCHAPTCPVCGEPVTGFDYYVMTGHHLIPCGHYVTTVQLAAVQQAVADYITEREQA